MADPDVPTPHPHGRTLRALVALAATLSLLITVGGSWGMASYLRAQNDGGSKIDVPTGGDEPGPGDDRAFGPCVEGVCNYLLLGSDSRRGLTEEEQRQFGTDRTIGGENRADTIMLVHTDPKLQKAIILSFPRDLWVNIPGRGFDKINASFEGGLAGGGAELVGRTVHRLTGLKINHVLYVDLAGFQGVVEALGGVEMCIGAENVNTPGYVEGESGSVYYPQKGYIADPFTGLLVKPGCQTLPPDQALAYVRTRHLRCDASAPDFYRITRQQQFLRAVINKIMSPSQLAQAPTLVGPVLENLRRDENLKIADLVYLVGQLRGISSGQAEFRTIPGYPVLRDGLAVIELDPSAEQIFRAVREGRSTEGVGEEPAYTPPSEATIPVPVVDRSSRGQATVAEQILSEAGFDIGPGIVPAASFGSKVQQTTIAYRPGSSVEAQVIGRYFPGVRLLETTDLPKGSDVALFVTADWEPVEPGSGPAPTTDCVSPTA